MLAGLIPDEFKISWTFSPGNFIKRTAMQWCLARFYYFMMEKNNQGRPIDTPSRTPFFGSSLSFFFISKMIYRQLSSDENQIRAVQYSVVWNASTPASTESHEVR